MGIPKLLQVIGDESHDALLAKSEENTRILQYLLDVLTGERVESWTPVQRGTNGGTGSTQAPVTNRYTTVYIPAGLRNVGGILQFTHNNVLWLNLWTLGGSPGDVLTWPSTGGTPAWGPPELPFELTDLEDVTITTPEVGDILKYTTEWVNGRPQMVVYTKTANATLTVKEVSYGFIRTGAALTLTLPTVASCGVGSFFRVWQAVEGEVTIDPDSDDRIVVDGTALTDGEAILLSGGIGNYVEMIAESSDGWTTLGSRGTLSATADLSLTLEDGTVLNLEDGTPITLEG